MDWVELGYFGLFLASFLAATVLPFSSELVLAAMLVAGLDPIIILIVATLGNCLGGMSSYGLGYLGDWKRISTWLKLDEKQIGRWQPKISAYGSWMALLCWVPFIGDPIAVALGIFRVNWKAVTLFMFIGKFMRYLVVIELI